MLLRPVLMPILRNPLQGIADGIRNMLAELLGSSQFFAPLTHSLVLARGTGSPTSTRASTDTVMGYGPTANPGDDAILLTVAANEARFEGARRISEGVWSNTYADGTPLPTTYTYDAVSLNGVAGTYVSTPDSVAASVTGDIDIRVKAALTDWTPAAENWLVGKIAGSGVRSYDMYVAATSGLLVLRASIDGTSVPQWNSTVAPTVSDGGVLWVRGCRVASTGAVTFYTSTDGDTWTQLGTVVAGTSGAIFDSTSVLTVGSNIGGATPTSGKIYQTQIYNGINGTLAVDFDASRYAGGTTLAGSTGETWTLNGSATITTSNDPATGLLSEGAVTQYLGVTATPATQTTASLDTGIYTLWCEGTGSCIASAGTATITGAAAAIDGFPDAFTVTVAGTV